MLQWTCLHAECQSSFAHAPSFDLAKPSTWQTIYLGYTVAHCAVASPNQKDHFLNTAARSVAKTRYGPVLWLLAGYLLAMAIALRAPLTSGFDLGFGDRADGLIEISLLEHWHRILITGQGAWRQTLYFFPYADTLGYNDGYLLYGLVFSFWRQWFDPFLSDTLNIATWKTLGFFASYLLVARVLRWERPVAILVAVLFTIANGMAVQAVHAQLQLVALIPVVASLAMLLMRAELAGRRGRAATLAASLAALLGLWLLTGYYLAWFTCYFTVILALCWLWTLGPRRWQVLRQQASRHWRTAAVFGITLILACLPFLATYGPKLVETGGQAYEHARSHLCTPIDIANVGPGNYLWGWIFSGLRNGVKAVGAMLGFRIKPVWIIAEHESGFPLIELCLMLGAAWTILRRRPPDSNPGLRLFTLAVIVSWGLTIQLGYLSPWGLVYWLVPGARGLRVVSRYQLWLILPLLLVAAGAWRTRFVALWATSPLFVIALPTLLIVEQLNGARVAEVSRSQQLHDLGQITSIPALCPAFFVVSARRYTEAYKGTFDVGLYPHNVDAMLLSELWGKPTINGYSTFNPPDWDLARPTAPDYEARVAAYAQRHGIPTLCRLDARSQPQWQLIRYPHGNESVDPSKKR